MNNNKIVNSEKAHFTPEERIIYIKSMISVAEENNLSVVVNHYKKLLKLLEKNDNNIYKDLSSKSEKK